MDQLNQELKHCEFMLEVLEDLINNVKNKFMGRLVRIQYITDSDYEDGEVYNITLEDARIKLHIRYLNGWYGYHNTSDLHRTVRLLGDDE